MKQLIVIILLSFASCGRESSPEGRSQIRDEAIEKQIENLKSQNKAILDSIKMLKREIEKLQQHL